MEDLPPSLLIDILSRLPDSADLARCRLVSRTLNASSYEVHSLRHLCTRSRYRKYRPGNGNPSAPQPPPTPPFKSVFCNLVRNSRGLQSVSIGVDKSLGRKSYDEVEDDGDDLYLTDVTFMAEWVPAIGGGLRSLSISDFWSQSSWRRSDALTLISSYCYNLVELELKNTWLSVDGLKLMPKLRSLTLEYIRLDDEDLNKVNGCFPGLQVLNLTGVGGLREPKIDLMHLKICHWTVSNAPTSLTILAPNLVELKLECVRPSSLILETPSLSNLHLTIERASYLKLKDIPSLTSLQLAAGDLHSLMGMFRSSRAVKMLAVDILRSSGQAAPMLNLDMLFDYFPNVSSLELGNAAWSKMAVREIEAFLSPEGYEGRVEINGLKEITARLVVDDVGTDLPLIASIVRRCTNLSGFGLLIHREVDPSVASRFIWKCSALWPRVRWRWGIWKEGSQDSWHVNCNCLKQGENSSTVVD